MSKSPKVMDNLGMIIEDEDKDIPFSELELDEDFEKWVRESSRDDYEVLYLDDEEECNCPDCVEERRNCGVEPRRCEIGDVITIDDDYSGLSELDEIKQYRVIQILEFGYLVVQIAADDWSIILNNMTQFIPEEMVDEIIN